MKKRRLGKTNLMISEIGFGGIPIQRVTQEQVCALLPKLVEHGINFIDTANGYTVSETFLGNALENIRDQFYIATKSMIRTSDIEKHVEQSLKALKTDHIDLYQLHNVKTQEEYDLVMSENGAYAVLKKYQEKGIVKHIGVTSHNVDLMLEHVDDMPFETIQVPYNMIENQADELFRKAKQNDIGIICMKPLAGGAIDNGKVAIAYILQNENVSVAIPGMNDEKEIIENAEASSYVLNQTDKEYIQKIKDELGNDFCRRCNYCAPCTQGIDIPMCFMMEGYYTRYHLEDWSKERYNSLAHPASECIRCGACETRCPYNLKIMDKLEKVKAIFGK